MFRRKSNLTPPGHLGRVAVITALALASANADIQIEGYQSEVHDRFVNDRMGETFVGDGFDWSGVGKRINGASFSNWATLISDQFFVSANHAKPGVGSIVRFWEDNDLGGAHHDRTVVSGQRIGSTDLWVGRLDSVLPGTIAHYEIPTSLITTLTSDAGCLDSYANTEVFTVGIRGERNFAIGKNRYDVGDETSERNGDFTAVGFIEDLDADTNFIDDHESFLQGGDSGAPSFQVNGGNLELVGIHSYITDSEVYSDSSGLSEIISCRTLESSLDTDRGRFISYDNFVPEARSQILAVAAVPEPPAWAFVGLCVIGAAIRQGWRR